MIPVHWTRLTFELDTRLVFPDWAGNLWRSAFGARLRQMACTTGAATCRGCDRLAHCDYGSTFETPTSAVQSGPLSHHTDVPHPYLLYPEPCPVELRTGDRVCLQIGLIGPAAARSGAWLSAAQSLQLGPAHPRLVALAPIDPRSDERDDATDALRALPPDCPAAPPGDLLVSLVSPMRIRRQERQVGPADFDFAALFGALLRRLSMLHQYAWGTPLEAEFAEVSRLARAVPVCSTSLRWFDWSRRSARQQRSVPMGGVLGDFIVRDLPPALWPYLWAGQWLHAGKGTVLGLGRYRVSRLN